MNTETPIQDGDKNPVITETLSDASDEPETQDFFAGLDGDIDVEEDDFDPANLPPVDFATPPHVVLKDGTEFDFKIPDLASERRGDNLRKTLILTSPARVNGFNPTQETTDYATADWRYFVDNLEKVRGFKLTADGDASATLNARDVVRTDTGKDGKPHQITVAQLIPVKHARAAVARMYGGKIEVEKPETDEARILVLNEVRYIVVKQEFGVEQNDDGTFSNPTNIGRYIFREPTSKELSFWQTKCFLGYKIPIKGGGAREERYFNTDKTVELFDKLIERVEGCVYNGAPVNVKDAADLLRIPAGVKRTAVTIAMGEVSGDVGKS